MKALVTGITGQDGSYLTEFLLNKGYYVRGIVRRTSTFNRERIEHLINHKEGKRLSIVHGDMTDGSHLIEVIKDFKPDEIYHLAAQSHVHVSFNIPEYTSNVDALGTLRLLDAVRLVDPSIRIYNAATSEMFGNPDLYESNTQNEDFVFNPQSPYAISKLFSYYMCKTYREAYNMFICNGILYNHESPRRQDKFVTRKITIGVSEIVGGTKNRITLGNLNAKRDWGYALEYVEAMWLILQQKKPDDYVISTGESHSIREFVEVAFKKVGIDIIWKGKGLHEKGIDKKTNKVYVDVSPKYFRPIDVEYLCGDNTKANRILGWKPKVKFEELVRIMMESDLKTYAPNFKRNVKM